MNGSERVPSASGTTMSGPRWLQCGWGPGARGRWTHRVRRGCLGISAPGGLVTFPQGLTSAPTSNITYSPRRVKGKERWLIPATHPSLVNDEPAAGPAGVCSRERPRPTHCAGAQERRGARASPSVSRRGGKTTALRSTAGHNRRSGPEVRVQNGSSLRVKRRPGSERL